MNKAVTNNVAQPDSEQGKFERILDAAQSVLAASGSTGGPMPSLSKYAVVAQSIIHYSFQSKEQLLSEFLATLALSIHGASTQRLYYMM